MAATLTSVPSPVPRSPAAPGPHARIARLILARGWDAATVRALFDGLDISPAWPAGLAAAITEASRP